MKLIPDGTKFDFMGSRKIAFILSGSLMVASLLLIALSGLNQGIDFKGGSALIIAFDAAQPVDRGDIESTIVELVSVELGDDTSQVSVQDFDVGVANETDGKPSTRYLVYTEITSLISDAKRAEVGTALKAAFGEDTVVDTPAEGADVFYLTFTAPTGIPERYEALTGEFAKLGYANVRLSCDTQKAEEVQWLEGIELIEEEASKTPEGQKSEFAQTKEAFEAQLAAKLKGRTDKRFTVTVEELKGKMTQALEAKFPGGQFVAVESSTSVSPSVGRDLLANGLLAILYAIIGILLYITLRFDFRYAPGAVVALLHDVIFTLGIFSLLQVKFSLPIIAALLTIVGYSLNDTIVVLDRVRETFDAYRGRDLKDLLNRAVNATLSRTVLTSLTTLLVITTILVWGGGLIQDFALALLIGVVVGTYSSIFIASPLVYYMDQYISRKEAASSTL